MKLLFDQNLSFKLCPALADLFPGSSQVRLLGLERADDRTIWEYAKANHFARYVPRVLYVNRIVPGQPIQSFTYPYSQYSKLYPRWVFLSPLKQA